MLTIHTINAQKRTKVRTNPLKLRDQDNDPRESDVGSDYDEDIPSEPASQYYSTPRNQDEQNRVLLVTADDEYNGLYGHPTTRSRIDYNRPLSKSVPGAARSKEVPPKETVQTIRNYSKVNDDGSFTFGNPFYRTKFFIELNF